MKGMTVTEVLQAILNQSAVDIDSVATAIGVERSALEEFAANGSTITLGIVDKMFESLDLAVVQVVNWKKYAEDRWNEVEPDLWSEFTRYNKSLDEYFDKAWAAHCDDAWKESFDKAWREVTEDFWKFVVESDKSMYVDYHQEAVSKYKTLMRTEYELWADMNRDEIYQRWHNDVYPGWLSETRKRWEQQERARLDTLPWVRFAEQ